MEAEELDSPAERGQAAVGDALAPGRPQAFVEQLEIGRELSRGAVAPVPEPPPHEAELAPVGLVAVAVAELGGVLRQLPLVARDRLEQIRGRVDYLAGDPDCTCELADLVAIRREHELARALERLSDCVGSGGRVAVLVAPDPRPEAKRRRRRRQQLPIVREQELRHAQQALLEEPEAVADLVDDARPARAHLVGLPEERHFLRQRRLDAPPAGGRQRRIVELCEKSAQAQMGGEHAAPCRLGRVCGQHELEREPARGALELRLLDPSLPEAGDRLRERLTRHPPLVLVLASAAEAVVLLGEVRELEVDAERPQNERLALRP